MKRFKKFMKLLGIDLVKIVLGILGGLCLVAGTAFLIMFAINHPIIIIVICVFIVVIFWVLVIVGWIMDLWKSTAKETDES